MSEGKTILKLPQSFRNILACEKCGMLSEANDEPSCECGEYGRTQYFEGMIALADPHGSWVAKWQKIKYPGMYSIKKINTKEKKRSKRSAKSSAEEGEGEEEEEEIDENDDFIASEEEEEVPEEDEEDEEDIAVPIKKKAKTFADDDFSD